MIVTEFFDVDKSRSIPWQQRPMATARLLGHRDDEELRDANLETLRYQIWHLAARLAVTLATARPPPTTKATGHQVKNRPMHNQ